MQLGSWITSRSWPELESEGLGGVTMIGNCNSMEDLGFALAHAAS